MAGRVQIGLRRGRVDGRAGFTDVTPSWGFFFFVRFFFPDGITGRGFEDGLQFIDVPEFRYDGAHRFVLAFALPLQLVVPAFHGIQQIRPGLTDLRGVGQCGKKIVQIHC